MGPTQGMGERPTLYAIPSREPPEVSDDEIDGRGSALARLFNNLGVEPPSRLAVVGHGDLLLPGAVGVGLNLALRGSLALRHSHPWVSVLLHPCGVLSLLAIAVNSFVWTRTGQLRWRGRTYAARASRVQ